MCCPRCLDPDFKELCDTCKKRDVDFKLICFGIYYGWENWVDVKKNGKWDPFSSLILNNKPYKKRSKKNKEKIGKKFASLLRWLIIEEKKINIKDFAMIVPIPTNRSSNQVDLFGEPLSELLGLEYKTYLLRKNKDSSYEYTGPKLNGENLILLDDVYSGNKGTIETNTKNLLENGAGEILSVVLARTLEISRYHYPILRKKQ